MRLATLSLLLLFASSILLACGACQPRPAVDSGPDAIDSAAVETSPAVDEVPEAAPCEGTVGFDDGSFETGYGFVPSAQWGIYLQRFDAPELGGQDLEEVCVCWLKTRGDATADFEILIWDETDRKLAPAAFATIPGSAEDIPTSKEEAGRLFPVEIDDVTLPEAPFWVGVRWNPSEENFLFVCADHGSDEPAEGEPIPAVFQEDRAGGWADVLTARDPIFHGHRALGVRVSVAEPTAD